MLPLLLVFSCAQNLLNPKLPSSFFHHVLNQQCCKEKKRERRCLSPIEFLLISHCKWLVFKGISSYLIPFFAETTGLGFLHQDLLVQLYVKGAQLNSFRKLHIRGMQLLFLFRWSCKVLVPWVKLTLLHSTEKISTLPLPSCFCFSVHLTPWLACFDQFFLWQL